MLALQGGALLSQGPTRERFAKKAGQQLNAPPGSVSQPTPPHLPQYAGQQADTLVRGWAGMPSAGQLKAGPWTTPRFLRRAARCANGLVAVREAPPWLGIPCRSTMQNSRHSASSVHGPTPKTCPIVQALQSQQQGP